MTDIENIMLIQISWKQKQSIYDFSYKSRIAKFIGTNGVQGLMGHINGALFLMYVVFICEDKRMI